MKEYRGCEYCTLEDIKNGNYIKNILPSTGTEVALPVLLIKVNTINSIKLNSGIKLEDIAAGKYTEESLEKAQKEIIDIYMDEYIERKR